MPKIERPYLSTARPSLAIKAELYLKSQSYAFFALKCVYETRFSTPASSFPHLASCVRYIFSDSAGHNEANII